MSSPSRLAATQSAPAATATTTTNSSSDTTTKKKFGKNLNKLTAPPVVNTTQGNNKTNSSSKNGFLLLSTKRTAATASGGILSSKSAQNSSKPIPNLGLHTEFTSSTHDALLGVVVGASRLESQQQPDAWGVAEKQQQEQSQQSKAENSKEHASALPSVGANNPSHEANISTDSKEITNDSVREKEHQHPQEKDQIRSTSDSGQAEFRTSNWDEYGGRHLHTKEGNFSDETSGKHSSNDDQVAYMKKLARQRAEKKRDEEQHRMSEQKERAAQRLRELEEKMAMKKTDTSAARSTRPTKDYDNHNNENKGRSRIVLEKLKQKDSATMPVSTTPPRTQRTLYDPNAPGKSYSSLVVGSPSVKQERMSKSFDQPTKPQPSHAPSSKKNAGPSQPGTYSADPESFDRQSVIQLTSYDDRDRGDRSSSAAPRMLFDPKSGSMIEVTSRDEGAAGGRNRKTGKKNKNSRDKHSKKDPIVEGGGADSKGRRKFKGGKEVNSGNNRLKGGGGESSSKLDKRLKIADPRKLPRTCGVLYTRDKKGGFYCSDGCEGDLGYGVHSVPGGRVKNSEAYSKYIECQKQMKEELATYNAGNHGDVALTTGFMISDVKEPIHEWIKPNEKIELITGNEDSPTLQATAREWAPSHTAFALSDREKMTLSSTRSLDENDDKDEKLEEDHDAPLGLGFDPTLNMDSVIQSPSIGPSDGLRAVDLTSLSLEPALKGPANNSHIFAFDSSGTWGASNSAVNNDWGVHSGNTYGTAAKESGSVPTPFMSLSTGNTWGGFASSLNGGNLKSSGE